MIDMGIAKKIDHEVHPHGNWQGLSVGMVTIIWSSYILTEQDHRLVAVRDWVSERAEMFNRLLGIHRYNR